MSARETRKYGSFALSSNTGALVRFVHEGACLEIAP